MRADGDFDPFEGVDLDAIELSEALGDETEGLDLRPKKELTSSDILSMTTGLVSTLRDRILPQGRPASDLTVRDTKELITALGSVINSLEKHKHTTAAQRASTAFEACLREVFTEIGEGSGGASADLKEASSEILRRVEEKLEETEL